MAGMTFGSYKSSAAADDQQAYIAKRMKVLNAEVPELGLTLISELASAQTSSDDMLKNALSAWATVNLDSKVKSLKEENDEVQNVTWANMSDPKKELFKNHGYKPPMEKKDDGFFAKALDFTVGNISRAYGSIHGAPKWMLDWMTPVGYMKYSLEYGGKAISAPLQAVNHALRSAADQNAEPDRWKLKLETGIRNLRNQGFDISDEMANELKARYVDERGQPDGIGYDENQKRAAGMGTYIFYRPKGNIKNIFRQGQPSDHPIVSDSLTEQYINMIDELGKTKDFESSMAANWRRTNDGEHYVTPDRQRSQLQKIEDAGLKGDAFDLAMYMGQGHQPEEWLVNVEKLDPTSEEFKNRRRAISPILQNDVFNDAVKEMRKDEYKVSAGRNIARALRIPVDTLSFDIISGAADFAWTMKMDPVLLAGQGLKTYKFLKRAVDASELDGVFKVTSALDKTGAIVGDDSLKALGAELVNQPVLREAPIVAETETAQTKIANSLGVIKDLDPKFADLTPDVFDVIKTDGSGLLSDNIANDLNKFDEVKQLISDIKNSIWEKTDATGVKVNPDTGAIAAQYTGLTNEEIVLLADLDKFESSLNAIDTSHFSVLKGGLRGRLMLRQAEKYNNVINRITSGFQELLDAQGTENITNPIMNRLANDLPNGRRLIQDLVKYHEKLISLGSERGLADYENVVKYMKDQFAFISAGMGVDTSTKGFGHIFKVDDSWRIWSSPKETVFNANVQNVLGNHGVQGYGMLPELSERTRVVRNFFNGFEGVFEKVDTLKGGRLPVRVLTKPITIFSDLIWNLSHHVPAKQVIGIGADQTLKEWDNIVNMGRFAGMSKEARDMYRELWIRGIPLEESYKAFIPEVSGKAVFYDVLKKEQVEGTLADWILNLRTLAQQLGPEGFGKWKDKIPFFELYDNYLKELNISYANGKASEKLFELRNELDSFFMEFQNSGGMVEKELEKYVPAISELRLQYENINRWVGIKEFETINIANTNAVRAHLVQQFLEEIFYNLGIENEINSGTPDSPMRRFLTRLADKRYAINNWDTIASGLPNDRAALFPVSQFSEQMAIPDFRSLYKHANNLNWLQKAFRVALTGDFIEAAVQRYWKIPTLLRLGFVPRAAGEEYLAFFARQDFRAIKASLADSVLRDKRGVLSGLVNYLVSIPSRAIGELGEEFVRQKTIVNGKPLTRSQELLTRFGRAGADGLQHEAWQLSEMAAYSNLNQALTDNAQWFYDLTGKKMNYADYLSTWGAYLTANFVKNIRRVEWNMIGESLQRSILMQVQNKGGDDAVRLLKNTGLLSAYDLAVGVEGAAMAMARNPYYQAAIADDFKHLGGANIAEVPYEDVSVNTLESRFNGYAPGTGKQVEVRVGHEWQGLDPAARAKATPEQLAYAYALNANDPVVAAALEEIRNGLTEDEVHALVSLLDNTTWEAKTRVVDQFDDLTQEQWDRVNDLYSRLGIEAHDPHDWSKTNQVEKFGGRGELHGDLDTFDRLVNEANKGTTYSGRFRIDPLTYDEAGNLQDIDFDQFFIDNENASASKMILDEFGPVTEPKWNFSNITEYLEYFNARKMHLSSSDWISSTEDVAAEYWDRQITRFVDHVGDHILNEIFSSPRGVGRVKDSVVQKIISLHDLLSYNSLRNSEFAKVLSEKIPVMFEQDAEQFVDAYVKQLHNTLNPVHVSFMPDQEHVRYTAKFTLENLAKARQGSLFALNIPFDDLDFSLFEQPFEEITDEKIKTWIETKIRNWYLYSSDDVTPIMDDIVSHRVMDFSKSKLFANSFPDRMSYVPKEARIPAMDKVVDEPSKYETKFANPLYKIIWADDQWYIDADNNLVIETNIWGRNTGRAVSSTDSLQFVESYAYDMTKPEMFRPRLVIMDGDAVPTRGTGFHPHEVEIATNYNDALIIPMNHYYVSELADEGAYGGRVTPQVTRQQLVGELRQIAAGKNIDETIWANLGGDARKIAENVQASAVADLPPEPTVIASRKFLENAEAGITALNKLTDELYAKADQRFIDLMQRWLQSDTSMTFNTGINWLDELQQIYGSKPIPFASTTMSMAQRSLVSNSPLPEMMKIAAEADMRGDSFMREYLDLMVKLKERHTGWAQILTDEAPAKILSPEQRLQDVRRVVGETMARPEMQYYIQGNRRLLHGTTTGKMLQSPLTAGERNLYSIYVTPQTAEVFSWLKTGAKTGGDYASRGMQSGWDSVDAVLQAVKADYGEFPPGFEEKFKTFLNGYDSEVIANSVLDAATNGGATLVPLSTVAFENADEVNLAVDILNKWFPSVGQMPIEHPSDIQFVPMAVKANLDDPRFVDLAAASQTVTDRMNGHYPIPQGLWGVSRDDAFPKFIPYEPGEGIGAYQNNIDEWSDRLTEAIDGSYTSPQGHILHEIVAPTIRGTFGVDAMSTVPTDRLPNMLYAPKEFIVDPNWLDKVATKGFGVINKAIFALVRNPMYTLALADGWEVATKQTLHLRNEQLDRAVASLFKDYGIDPTEARSIWSMIPEQIQDQIGNGTHLETVFDNMIYRNQLGENSPLYVNLFKMSMEEREILINWMRMDANMENLKMRVASMRAMSDVVPFIDDHKVRSFFQDYARNIMPFEFAQESFLKRWVRTALYDPAAVRRAQLVAYAATNNVFTHRDEYGNVYFIVPMSGALNQLLSKGWSLPFFGKVQIPERIGMTINMRNVLPGIPSDFENLPQLSPYAMMGVDEIVKQFPETAKVFEFFHGGRPINPDENFLDLWVPRNWQRVYSSILGERFGDPESMKQELAAATIGAMQQMEASAIDIDRQREQLLSEGRIDEANALSEELMVLRPLSDNPQSMQDYIDRVKDWARKNMFARAVIGFTLGTTPSNQFEGAELSGEFKKLLSEMDYDNAITIFLQEHPNGAPYTIFAQGKNTKAPLPRTEKALDWMRQNQSWLQAYPDAAPWLMPQASTKDAYSAQATNEQVAAGLRWQKDAYQWYKDYKFAETASYYFDMKSNFDVAIADAPTKEQATALRSQWTLLADSIKQQNPLFASELEARVSTESQRTLESLDKVLKLPDSELPAGIEHLDLLRQAVRAWRSYRDAYDALKNQNTKAAREEREGLRRGLILWGRQFVSESPEMYSFWNSIVLSGTDLVSKAETMKKLGE